MRWAASMRKFHSQQTPNKPDFLGPESKWDLVEGITRQVNLLCVVKTVVHLYLSTAGCTVDKVTQLVALAAFVSSTMAV